MFTLLESLRLLEDGLVRTEEGVFLLNAYSITTAKLVLFRGRGRTPSPTAPLPRGLLKNTAGKGGDFRSYIVDNTTILPSLPSGEGSNVRPASVAEGQGWGPPPIPSNFNRIRKTDVKH